MIYIFLSQVPKHISVPNQNQTRKNRLNTFSIGLDFSKLRSTISKFSERIKFIISFVLVVFFIQYTIIQGWCCNTIGMVLETDWNPIGLMLGCYGIQFEIKIRFINFNVFINLIIINFGKFIIISLIIPYETPVLFSIKGLLKIPLF